MMARSAGQMVSVTGTRTHGSTSREKVAAQEDEEEEEADWVAVYAREKPREDSFRPGIQSNARLPFSAGVEDTRNVHRYH